MNGTVELLWWEGCPSHPQALRQLRDALAELNMDWVHVEQRRIASDGQAEVEKFVGSPTFRVDGRELLPVGGDDVFALSCRVYRLRDGRFSPTPDPEDLKEALRKEFSGR